MTPVVLFSLFAIVWTLYSVQWARRRYWGDGQALALGLVAALGTTAVLLLIGFLVSGPPAALWWILPLAVVVLVATVSAERRRTAILTTQKRGPAPDRTVS